MPCPSSFSRWAAGLRGRRPGWPSPRSPTSSWSRPLPPRSSFSVRSSPRPWRICWPRRSAPAVPSTTPWSAVGLATCIATLFSLVPDFVSASWAEDLLRPSPARTPLTPLQPRIRVVGSPVPRDADSRHPGNGRQSGSPTRAVAVAGINRLRRWAARDVGHPHPGHRAADAVRPDQPFRPPLRRQRRRGPAGSPPAAVRVAPSPPGDDGARPSEKLARLADVTGADVDPPDRAADHERTPTAGRRHGPGRGRGMRQRRPGAGTGRTGAASPPGPAPADTPPAGAPAAVAHCVTRRPTKPRSGSGGTHPSMAPRGLFSTGTSGTS